MKLNIICSRSFTYPGQHNPQDRVFDVNANGKIDVHVNSEIGNAVPINIWNGIIQRFTIPHGFTRSDIIQFYKENKTDFKNLIDGMITKYNGNNWVGNLTGEARDAVDSIHYKLYSSY